MGTLPRLSVLAIVVGSVAVGSAGCSAKDDAPMGEGGPQGDDGSGSGGADTGTFTSVSGSGAVDGGADDAPGTGAVDGPGDDGVDESGGAGFVLTPDGGGANECDPKEQDCMRGEKCTAWANDGGTFWNANRCVELVGEGQPGDPCMVEGSGVSGVDDCALGSICLNTDENGVGICTAFCDGNDESCPPSQTCAIYNDGVLPICLVSCDPLLQNCMGGQSCIDTPNQTFICFNDASGETGADGDACPPEHGENSCDPGMWCGAGSFGCEDVNCCTPFCDIEGNDCTAPDECVSFFGDPASAPPGYETVGVCVLP
jgi:hypothetical protein